MTNNNNVNTSTPSTQALEERLSVLLNSDKFSVASYLNLALGSSSSGDDSSDIQRKMAELALQLQLQTQSCHEDIGRIGAELQAVLPRCAADVNRVSIGLEGMKMDASVLLEQVHHTNSEVSSSLETLSTLHALRTNLSKTKEILQAAATWDSTLSSIAPLVAQQNLSQAVQQLQQLERGERALRGMPNNKQQRKEAIQKIRTQIQTLLQPQLKHALLNMHTRLAPLQQCVQLYTALNTLDTLQEEYVKNRPTQIHKAWFSYSPTYQQQNDENNDSEAPPSFVKFLPNWFDAVLSLLAEERRQSFAVFGPDLAPSIITKVLWECFRPILSSFQSRLDSLYSSSSQDVGSLQSICVVYEATLEFLSLAYESVAGSYLDVAETTSIRAPSLYEDVMAVILQIASPFSTFQERLAQLEEKHSNVARQLISKDIQQTAHSASPTSLSSLQDATERLQDLSPFIFPLAEGAIGRFELLNGGYRATKALDTVDKLMSSHAGELAIAVRTLSATMTANENHLAENFDEQHVLCALQVLKVAGTFLRDLKAFETKTRERMGLLTERMIAFQTQEKELEEAVGASSSSSTSFLLPDSLSVVEVDSMLTKAVCGGGASETDAALSVLQRLASTENPVALYPQSEESVFKLAGSCHSFVFDVCSAVPRKHLSGMPSMSAWTKSSGADSIDSYGTLPQSYITQVGEHMLALVQALEPFASDSEALELAQQVMAGVKLVASQPWREFLAAAGASDSEEVAEALMNGKDLAGYVLAGGLAEEDEDEEEEQQAEDEAAKFCNSWLDVVGLAVTGRLFERILRIQRLTPKGCDHLAADLNYLINVLSALGVSGHPHPLVNHFAQLVMMDDASLREQIASRDRRNAVLAALRAVEVRIALMRGISSAN